MIEELENMIVDINERLELPKQGRAFIKMHDRIKQLRNDNPKFTPEEREVFTRACILLSEALLGAEG